MNLRADLSMPDSVITYSKKPRIDRRGLMVLLLSLDQMSYSSVDSETS
jgi:hypothetical protein